MKKRELKMIIKLMTEEIAQQKAAARHYRQERNLKALELKEARQAANDLFEEYLIAESSGGEPK